MKSAFFHNGVLYLSFALFFSACASYKQNIMFQVSDGSSLQKQIDNIERNYSIQKYDYVEVEVFTNKGEKIIDADFRTSSGEPSGTPPVKPTYFIDANGVGKFPMIGEVKLEGFTVREAEEVLQQAYSKFYADTYVVLKYTNKRVILLGATGGQVIPLTNENTRLAEVLALAKGVGNDAKAQNIRVLRGEQVFVADFSTVEGYVKNNLLIQSGDIVYVEPIRRPLTEGFRDYGPMLSIVTSLTTLIIVILSQ